MPESEVSRPMSDNELMEMTKDESRFFILGMLVPPRIGVTLFGSILEYRHYPPDTPRNDLFQLVMVKWEEMLWGVMSIPIEDKVYAERVAKECGLKLADGIPTLIDGTEEKGYKTFPITDNDRVLTLEYVSNHIAYTNDHIAISNLNLQETMLINSIYKGNLGPFEFKVVREGR